VTIIPRGRALGVTHQLPSEERHTLPEDYLHGRIAVSLGGRVAERELLGSVSSGADDDIRGATALARAMVARWGMSKDLGPVDLCESDEHPFLGREIALPRRFSDASANEVDKEVRAMLLAEETRAAEIIRNNRDGLNRLIAALEAEESLDRAAIEAALGAAPHKAARPALVHNTGTD
jgi:cell division protease FtsH